MLVNNKEVQDMVTRLKELPQLPFPEDKRRQILCTIKGTKTREWSLFSNIKIMGISAIVLLISFILFGQIELGNTSKVIRDHHTPQDLPTTSSISGEELIIHYGTDNMDRGNHDLMKDLVVAPLKSIKNLQRGDIVYFSYPDLSHFAHLTPGDTGISRVVGLPGEKIEIIDGQIFINGKKLVSFYGKEHNRGIPVENSEIQFPELKIAQDEFFVIGDNWWRSIDSILFGPLNKNQIIGEVIKVHE